MSAPSTPRNLGYRMPAEWETHEATWLSWPSNPITWKENIEDVESAYLQMIRYLSESETVKILADTPDECLRVRKLLSDEDAIRGKVELIAVPTVDVWIRDYGPNYLLSADRTQRAYNRWKFNAWGGKYSDLASDDSVRDELRSKGYLKDAVFEPGIILEGGSIDVNGSGLCLTTQQCLLNPNRNPNLTKETIDKYLKDYLNVSDVIWLQDGVEGDDTDGHVDDITRFVDQNTILTVYESDDSDVNHLALHNNLETLRAMRKNMPDLKIELLPMPEPVYYEGERLPASYANFYIANHCVLVPVFNCKQDYQALSVLETVFPNRKVVGIDCRTMVRGYGSIHCATQQEVAVCSGG